MTLLQTLLISFSPFNNGWKREREKEREYERKEKRKKKKKEKGEGEKGRWKREKERRMEKCHLRAECSSALELQTFSAPKRNELRKIKCWFYLSDSWLDVQAKGSWAGSVF